MAMTKKERAEFDAAILKAETLGALRWTSPVARDVQPPPQGYSEGWDFNAYDKGKVWLGWSDRVGHGAGPAPIGDRYRSASQGARRMFSTKLLALQAMRHEMEQKFAETLRSVDCQIAAEKAGKPNDS